MAAFDHQYPAEWGPRMDALQACPAHGLDSPSKAECGVCHGAGVITPQALARYVDTVNRATLLDR